MSVKSFSRVGGGKDFLVIKLEEKIRPGHDFILSMDFVFELRDDLAGLYRSSYRDEEGNRRYKLISQQKNKMMFYSNLVFLTR